jgi:hypothetical protein
VVIGDGSQHSPGAGSQGFSKMDPRRHYSYRDSGSLRRQIYALAIVLLLMLAVFAFLGLCYG